MTPTIVTTCTKAIELQKLNAVCELLKNRVYCYTVIPDYDTMILIRMLFAAFSVVLIVLL